jgi:branched-chain amino acid transport system permease protein
MAGSGTWVAVLLDGLILGGVYALIALGLNLQYAVAMILNLAYGELVMLGALLTYTLYTAGRLSPLVSLLAVAVVAGGVSAAAYLAGLRRVFRMDRREAEVAMLLLTFALLFLLQSSALMLWGAELRHYTFWGEPVFLLGHPFSTNRLVAAAGAFLLSGALYGILRWSSLGRVLRGMADNPRAAQLVGVEVERYRLVAFGIGGMLAGASGTLLSMFWSFSPTAGIDVTVRALVVIVLGGIGSVVGSLTAGLLLGVAESVVSAVWDPALRLTVNFAVLTGILLWRPRGLFGWRT